MSAKVVPVDLANFTQIQPKDRKIKSKRKIYEVIAFTLLILTTAATVCLSVVVYFTTRTTIEPKECKSTSCINTASLIVSAMDKSINPCDNFFHFMCNRWIDDNILIDQKSSTMNDLTHKVNGRILELLNQPLKEDQPEHVKKLLTFFKSCMNRAKLDELGTNPLMKKLNESIGWPAIGLDGSSKEGVISDLFIKLWNSGLTWSSILNFNAMNDVKNSSRYIFHIQEGFISLDRTDYLRNNEVFKRYKFMIEDLPSVFGAKNLSIGRTQMLEALDLELWIANNSHSMEESRNETLKENFLTLREIHEFCPSLEIKKIIDNTIGMSQNTTFSYDYVIQVDNTQYLEKLCEKLNETDSIVIRNYMAYRALIYASSALSNRFNVFLRLKDIQKSPISPGYGQCLHITEYYFPHPLANIYIKKYYSVEAKNQIQKMYDHIKKIFTNSVRRAQWMDDSTRAAALRKLDKIVSFIGYPENLLKDDFLNDFYKTVNISEDTFFKNAISMSKFYDVLSFKNLFDPVEKLHWTKHSLNYKVNAFYNFFSNSIDILAGISQGEFFEAGRPKYATYGGLGIVIGHEITHGFDNYGRKFDENGNKNDWWSEEAAMKFQQKSQCMIEQYNNYTIKGISLNGELTLPENIADNGGVRNSYFAYQNWKKEAGDEALLPGLDYNTNQLFWMTRGLVQCAEYTEKFIKRSVEKFEHSLEEARCNIPLQNMKEFAKDFNCPVGSNMNPRKKCVVW